MRTLSKMLTVLMMMGFVLGMSLPADASRADDYEAWRNSQGQDSKPVPEPSSALVFGAGLLVASQIARRRRA